MKINARSLSLHDTGSVTGTNGTSDHWADGAPGLAATR